MRVCPSVRGSVGPLPFSKNHMYPSQITLKPLPTIFRCVLASLYEGLSVRPSVCPWVRMSVCQRQAKTAEGRILLPARACFADGHLVSILSLPFVPLFLLMVMLVLNVDSSPWFPLFVLLFLLRVCMERKRLSTIHRVLSL